MPVASLTAWSTIILWIHLVTLEYTVVMRRQKVTVLKHLWKLSSKIKAFPFREKF